MPGQKRKRTNDSSIQDVDTEAETTIVACTSKVTAKVIRAFSDATGYQVYAVRDHGVLLPIDVLDRFATTASSMVNILKNFRGADEYKLTIYGSHDAIRRGWVAMCSVGDSAKDNIDEDSVASSKTKVEEGTNRDGNSVTNEGSEEHRRKRVKGVRENTVKREDRPGIKREVE
ncbi:hypothetical protein PFICI_13543 [Pestalotiopsis fici W106-1]|uniref:Uncharacterized protein n=1 Tax=Pestalotiopsis fici (strain W106-1 / CGMCC3.15140) TaxID=1229662 RepID=W3WMR5_PESFW|nr:uncharacterized protein PFICI_13543 [Pestalotiopsis fici W106-1]ETS75059.1 hypothetical protein PFICI_13543 [Pestalotiopsis fici W106-1]